MKAFIRDIGITLILAVLIFFGVRATIDHTVVISSSMEPTLQVGQHLIINKVVYKFHEPKRGDIVVFHPPSNNSRNAIPLIKRIIGLPGESVEIKDGMVYIHQEDGSVLPLDEPYIKELAKYPFKSGKIPENEYFMLGDNRNNSGDSREGWTVPLLNIIGKAWLSVWPPAEWGLAANYPLPSKIAGATNN